MTRNADLSAVVADGRPGQPDRADGKRCGSAYDARSLALGVIRIGPTLMLVAVIAVMATLPPVFLTTRNVGNVLAQPAVIAVLALGQLLVIVTRGIDLSVGSTVALAAMVGALVFESVPSGPLVILAMVATGIAVGSVNGMVYVWGRLPHPCHHDPRDPQRRPWPRTLALRRSAGAGGARHRPDRRRWQLRLAAVLDAAGSRARDRRSPA
jgi:hypothetical protein